MLRTNSLILSLISEPLQNLVKAARSEKHLPHNRQELGSTRISVEARAAGRVDSHDTPESSADAPKPRSRAGPKKRRRSSRHSDCSDADDGVLDRHFTGEPVRAAKSARREGGSRPTPQVVREVTGRGEKEG